MKEAQSRITCACLGRELGIIALRTNIMDVRRQLPTIAENVGRLLVDVVFCWIRFLEDG